MSHETLLAFSKKKSKPYNLALKLSTPAANTLNFTVAKITSFKYGFSPDANSITLNPVQMSNTSGVRTFNIPIPANTTKIYFKFPEPSVQLGSFLQINQGTVATTITEVESLDSFPLNQIVFSSLTGLTKVPDALWPKCRDMNDMFIACTAFNQALNWDTSAITSMSNMFYGCANFNQPINFDTVNVTNMSYMFQNCGKFNQLVNFNTSNVTLMNNMFTSCSNFNQPVNFNTVNVTNTANMFNSCAVFNQPVNFNTNNVTNMTSMFYACSVFNENITFSNVSRVTSINSMFYNCPKFNQNLSALNFKSSTTRSSYDTYCIAWIPVNKPKFTA